MAGRYKMGWLDGSYILRIDAWAVFCFGYALTVLRLGRRSFAHTYCLLRDACIGIRTV